jgi:periplasmic protein TonB
MKTKLLTFILMLVLAPVGISFAEENSDSIAIADLKENEKREELPCREWPQFPGGEKALMQFLRKNVRYPASAEECGIEGRVKVRFVVGKDGRPKNFEVIDRLSPECDAEALRVISLIRKWIPGKINGKPVATTYILPVRYFIRS